jgi:exonuclease III
MASGVNLDECRVAAHDVMNGNLINNSCDTHDSVGASSVVVKSVPHCEDNDISIISYNMHGFNQGKPSLDVIVTDFEPDFVLLQEHWLTPDRLDSISSYKNYVTFGCSSMYDRLSSGPLQGRPFGGLAILAHHRVAHACRSVATNDRYLVISYGDILLCNVYLPCRGTSDRATLVESILHELFDLRDNHLCGQCVLGGDLNVDFYDTDTFSVRTLEQFVEAGFKSCYESSIKPLPTYVNNALGHSSVLDYVYVAGGCRVTNFAVLELAVNFSYHCPISCVVTVNNFGLLAPFGQATLVLACQTYVGTTATQGIIIITHLSYSHRYL